VEFEWDENKRTENIKKHGLDFADAWQIFYGFVLVDVDNREDYGETRFLGIGFLRNIIVVIVFTEPDEETIRIISLRKALNYEREKFEQYIKDELGEN
jgi:uncharacterized DUF497 family protein